MKKLLAFILSALMIFFFIGCEDTTADNINEEDPSESAEKIDLSDYTFRFATIRPNEFFQEIGFSDTGDKIRQRYLESENFFGCKFEVLTTYTDVCSPTVLAAIAAATDVPDILDCNPDQGYLLYKADVLLPYEDIPTINLNDTKWGPVNFRQHGFFNGKTYGTFPYDWEFMPQIVGSLLINYEFLKVNSMTNPHEYAEQKQWTWDTFKEQLVTATFEDAEFKYIGLYLNDAPMLMETAIFSNGGQIVEENDGKYSFAADSDKAIKAMDWASGLKKEKLVAVTAGQVKEFTDGLTPFYLCDTWQGTIHIPGTEYLPSFLLEDYGFIQFPTSPDTEPETMSTYVTAGKRMNWLISETDNDPDDLGVIIDYIFAPLDGKSQEGWKAISNTIFHHPEDFDSFVQMVEKVNYDYSTHLPDSFSTFNTRLTNVFNGKAAAGEMSTVKDVMQTNIDAELNN